MTADVLVSPARHLFKEQTTVFKINVGIGFFLRNVKSCQVRCCYASHYTRLFPRPILVTDRENLTNFLSMLTAKDPIEHARQPRPTSKWRLECSMVCLQTRDYPTIEAFQLPEYQQ